MNVTDVKATIRQGDDAVREGRRALEAALSEITEAGALIRQTIKGGRHEDAKAMLDGLAEVRREIARTLRWLDAAVDHADQYRGRF